MKVDLYKNFIGGFITPLLMSSFLTFTSGASTIDASTTWGDIRPTNAVQRVVDNATAKTWAMFIIPMVSPNGTHYPHFELKATANNFSNGSWYESSSSHVLFYSMSSLNGDESYDSESEFYCDWMRILTVGNMLRTGNGDGDPRKFYETTDTLTLQQSIDNYWGDSSFYPRQYTVFVNIDQLRRMDDKSWLKNTNEDLTWTFIRYGDDGVERLDPNDTDTQVWNHIVPVKWFYTQPWFLSACPMY